MAKDQPMATSLRVYLEVDADHNVEATAERLADLLVELGFNHDDGVTAVIACISDSPDVEAWAEGPEGFVKALKGAAFIMVPDPGEDPA